MQRPLRWVWGLCLLATIACAEDSGGRVEPDPTPGIGPSVWLTVNGLPDDMNGSEPLAGEPFRLLLPTWGFTLDLRVAEGDRPIADGGVSLRCDCDDRELAGELGADLSFEVPEAMAFPEGDAITFTATVRDEAGIEAMDTLTVSLTDRTPALDPFARPERWLLTFTRDDFTVTASDGPGGYQISAEPMPNGVADFEEDLRILGLAGEDSAPGAAELERDGRTGVNAIFRGMFMDALLSQMRGHFDGVRLEIVLEGEPAAPSPEDFDPAGDFSILAFGGDTLNPDYDFGAALLDDHNQTQQDNSEAGLGIFTSNIARLLATNALTRDIVENFLPDVGSPIGTHPADPRILAPDFDRDEEPDVAVRARASALNLFLELAPLGLAAIASHEIGHSLGLVAPRPPPHGLFGGASEGSFIAGPADDNHIDTEGFNLMQTGASLQLDTTVLLSSTPAFNPINKAYLQRRLLYDPSR